MFVHGPKTCPHPIEDKLLPEEVCYADDCDFISYSIAWIKSVESKAPDILHTFNLLMNAEKTENTQLVRNLTTEEEHWRKIISKLNI